MSDLKRHTRGALIWSALDRGGQQLVYALTLIVTARLLAPELFGAVASLALFAGMATVLSEGGLSVALVRRREATEADHATVFYTNIALALFFYGVLWLAAPAIAAYNRAPELAAVARVHLSAIVLAAPGLIQSTQLIRRGDFRRLAVANVVPLMLSGATAVALAAAGAGVWALAVQAPVLAAARTGLLWAMSDWRPRAAFSRASFGALFGFSSKLLAGSVLTNLSNYFYASTLGNFVPLTRLGYYDRASKFKEAGTSMVAYTFGNSMLRMFAELQDDPARLVHAWRKSMRTAAFVVFAVLPGLAAVAPTLVETLIGPAWLPAAPYLRLLCVGGIFAVFNQMHASALKARGRSDLTLAVEAVGAGLLILFFFLTIRYGLAVALVSDAASRAIVWIVYSLISRRVFCYRLHHQLADLAPYALIGAAMAAAVWFVPRWIAPSVAALAVQLAVGAAVYLGAARLAGSRVLADAARMLRREKGAEV